MDINSYFLCRFSVLTQKKSHEKQEEVKNSHKSYNVNSNFCKNQILFKFGDDIPCAQITPIS
jgi:hypothetical protein